MTTLGAAALSPTSGFYARSILAAYEGWRLEYVTWAEKNERVTLLTLGELAAAR